MPSNKRFLVLIFCVIILSVLSFIRFFVLISNNKSTYHASLSVPNACSNDNSDEIINQIPNPPTEDILSPKEHQLVSNLISHRAPCNLLFFGFKSQLLSLAKLNSEGTTVFLEDDSEKFSIHSNKGMQIYLVAGHEKASEAYELLEHARGHTDCRPKPRTALHESKCRLVLKGLPQIVYENQWDIVVIDGPKGDRPEAPGRMGAIYTAALIARAGKSSDVVVHDTDRTIEKWYSWEFLCRENLVSSKGKLWHFRIRGNSSYIKFCSEAAHQIL